MSQTNNTTTTTTYEYRSSSPNQPQANYEFQANNNNAQTTNYEFSRTVGHPGPSYEHSGNYLTASGNLGGPGDFGTNTTNYEYSRTVGSPGQTYEYSSQPRYENQRKSATPAVTFERTSATYHDDPTITIERRVIHHDDDPIISRPYGHHEQRALRSQPPAKAPRKKSSDDEAPEEPNYDFNQKGDLVELMAEEHRQLRNTLPLVSTKVTNKDLILADYKPMSDDATRKTAQEILKEYENKTITTTTHHGEAVKKSAPGLVTSHHIVSEPTAEHHLEEWSRKKYLRELIHHDNEEEFEETRLDYCGLCVSKRKGRRPKY